MEKVRSLESVAPGRLARLAAPLGFAAALGGCATLGFGPSPVVPMRTVTLHETPAARCLFVLLPGRHSRAEAFGRDGFGAAVAARGLSADVLAADAHLGYYRERNVVERLHEDVLAPRRARYEEIWVVGTSLGGLGGLLLRRDHPEDVEGILTLAPFLGNDRLIEEIEGAGGPRLWDPSATSAASADPGRELWAEMRQLGWTEGAPLFIGWGERDRFARANAMLAALLPAERVLTDPGGHDMETWRRLWEQFLDRTQTCADPR